MDPTEAANKAAMWTYIGVMVGFKVVTVLVILYFTHAFTAVAILVALHIPWIVGALVLAGVPGMAYYRLVKVRARRKELIRQEFEVTPSALTF